jgi:hypothetical protein
MGRRTIPMPIGSKWGELTVLGLADIRDRARYRCQCSCGNEIVVTGSQLRRKTIVQCHPCGMKNGASRERQDERLWSMYGIHLADKEAMYEKQQGRCAMCGVWCFIDHMHVDHWHQRGEYGPTKGRVRELLCSRCNMGLGYVEDDEFREMALRYMDKHQQPTVGEQAT